MGWRHIVYIYLVIASLTCGNSQDTCGRNSTDSLLSFCTESSLNDTRLYLGVPGVSTVTGPCVCRLYLVGNTSGEISLKFTPHQTNETRNMINVTVDGMHVNGTTFMVNNTQIVGVMLITDQQPLLGNDSVTCIEISAENSTTINAMCFEYVSMPTTPSNEVTDEPNGTTQSTGSETSTVEESNTTQIMNKTNERFIFNIGIVIAAAAGGFVILVTIMTLILVSCCKRTNYDYTSDDVFARGDVHMSENQLYNATHAGDESDPASSKL